MSVEVPGERGQIQTTTRHLSCGYDDHKLTHPVCCNSAQFCTANCSFRWYCTRTVEFYTEILILEFVFALLVGFIGLALRAFSGENGPIDRSQAHAGRAQCNYMLLANSCWLVQPRQSKIWNLCASLVYQDAINNGYNEYNQYFWVALTCVSWTDTPPPSSKCNLPPIPLRGRGGLRRLNRVLLFRPLKIPWDDSLRMPLVCPHSMCSQGNWALLPYPRTN